MSVFCKICNEEFNNNLGGQLTNHLLNVHNITMEEYVIITEYNGMAPKCKCGYCSESPRFNRGVFSKYAVGHDTHTHMEHVYIKVNGNPKCLLCDCGVKFHRGVPNKLCARCKTSNKSDEAKATAKKIKYYGFQNEAVQSLIAKNVYEKYGVHNISQVPEYARKISENNKGIRLGVKLNIEHIIKIRDATISRWNCLEYKIKTSNSIKNGTNTPKERQRRRDYSNDRIKNEPGYLEFLIDVLSRNNSRTSKLHLKIRAILDLSNRGYISEHKMYPYIYDEVNLDKKIVIEINGDYVHGNPKKYPKDFLIRLPNTAYTVEEKQKYDEIKRIHAEKQGFSYVVIWESDLKEDSTLSKFDAIL